MKPSEAASVSVAPETVALGAGESSLADVQLQRDPLYYNEPLIILVSRVVIFGNAMFMTKCR